MVLGKGDLIDALVGHRLRIGVLGIIDTLIS